jgi:putative ABC transport system permease protein
MNLSFQYALRDLRGTFSSLRIVIICLFLGVSAIAAIQFTSHTVLSGIEKNGRSILGGDLVIRTIFTPAPNDLRQWLTKRNAALTDTTEARVMLANTTNGDSTLVELKAVENAYPLYGEFKTGTEKDLQSSLTNQGILLDKALRERLSLKMGDSVRLGSALFKVAGFIEAEPDRAGGSRFGLAPRAMISARDMASTKLFQTGSMVYYDLRVKLPPQTDLKPITTALKTDFPDAEWKVTDADNASPQIERFVNRLMLFLTLVGLSALLIGGIGIGNGVRAHFTTRLKTIAILKTLGAPIKFIENIYLWQILIITVIGTILGTIVGSLAPYFAAPFLSTLLPFTVEPQITWQALMIPAAFGFLTSFAFTLWPLGQAVKTSPIELFRSAISPLQGKPSYKFKEATALILASLITLAIGTAYSTSFAIWFVVGAVICMLIFYMIGKFLSVLAGRIPAPNYPALRLALRNLYRTGNATANTLISLGLGLTVMVSITLIEMNFRYGIVQNLPKDAPAFFFMDIQGDQKNEFQNLLSHQETARNIVMSPNLRGRIVSINGIPAADAIKDDSQRWLLQNDRGFTYTTDLPAHSEILLGAWWPSDYKGPPLVSVVEDVVKAFGVKIGDKITVNILGRDITATIANTRSVNWMNFTVNFAITFAPGALDSAPHSWLATVVADPAKESSIQRNITAKFPNISMIRLSDAISAAQTILGNMATAVRGTAAIALITGVFVLAGSLAATRTQRVYDIVILKVLGVPRSTLIIGFILEFAVLGLIAASLSLALGTCISWAVMSQLMNLPWHFYPLPAILTSLSGAALTLAIGWMVTGRVLSASAATHLRNE